MQQQKVNKRRPPVFDPPCPHGSLGGSEFSVFAVLYISSCLLFIYPLFLYESHDIFTGRCFAGGGKIPEGIFLKKSPCLFCFFFPFYIFCSSVNGSKTKMGTVILHCVVKLLFFYINGRTPYYKLLCF